MATASTDRDAAGQAAFHGLWLALPLAIVAGLLVLDRTDFDLVIAARLYDPVARAFPLRTTFLFDTILHHWTKYIVVLLACLAWGGYLLAHAVPGMRSYRRELLFLGMALVLAPAAVAGLKLLSDRHCPWDVVQFGGFAPYLALLDAAPTGLTPGRCFPAGHATTGFSLMAFHFVGWSLTQRRLSRAGLTLGLMVGLGLGFGRMAQGAHFLSHVLWSGLVCWIVLVALYALILCPRTRVGKLARAGRAPFVPLMQSNHGKEMMMPSEQKPAQERAAPIATPKKFRDMSFKQKAAYCSKAFICVISFGFAYPNIFVD